MEQHVEQIAALLSAAAEAVPVVLVLASATLAALLGGATR